MHGLRPSNLISRGRFPSGDDAVADPLVLGEPLPGSDGPGAPAVVAVQPATSAKSANASSKPRITSVPAPPSRELPGCAPRSRGRSPQLDQVARPADQAYWRSH